MNDQRREPHEGPLGEVAAASGLDLVGGVWTSATPTARWWFHGRATGPFLVVA